MGRYLALRLLVSVGGRLPARLLYAAAAATGTFAWYASPAVRRTTRAHMRHVLGAGAPARAVDAAARGCVRAAAYYYADFARYPRLRVETVFERLQPLEGIEALFAAYDRGRGVIFISAHLGNPEIISQALGPFGIDLAVVTEPLRPPRLHAFVERQRARHGVTYLPADLGGLRAARAHLKHGGTLGVLVDREVLGGGRPYAFFGEAAPMPTGAVELARRTGAAIVAGWVLRGPAPDRFHARLEAVPLPAPTGDRAADLDSGMRAVIAWLERAIAGAPGQWFPLVPVWPRPAASGPQRPRPVQ